MRIILILPLLFAVASCSSSKPSPTTANRIVLLKGDPLSFVEGTSMNSKVGIPESFFDDSTNWTVRIEFIETSEQLPPSSEISQEDLQRRASEGTEGAFVYISPVPYFLNDADDNKIFQFDQFDKMIFNKVGGSYFLRDAISNKVSLKDHNGLKILHYSHRTDGSMFSILTQRTSSENHNSLISYTFISQATKPVPKMAVGGDFDFISKEKGLKNQRLGWPVGGTTHMLICRPEFYTDTTTKSKLKMKRVVTKAFSQAGLDAANVWGDVLAEGKRLDFKAEVSKNCPPFSDVNTNTLFFVDNYVNIQGPESRTGYAINTTDHHVSTFTEGHIFIFMGDVDESNKSINPDFNIYDESLYTGRKIAQKRSLTRILTHEIGHFLGLDHRFDGTPSIMSYSQHIVAPRAESGHAWLYKYDIEAIQELYPVPSSEPEEDNSSQP